MDCRLNSGFVPSNAIGIAWFVNDEPEGNSEVSCCRQAHQMMIQDFIATVVVK
jgi:hypothetical protein